MEEGVEGEEGVLEDHVPGEDGGLEIAIAPAVGPDAGIENIHVERDAYFGEVILAGNGCRLLRRTDAAVEREAGDACFLQKRLRLVRIVFDDGKRVVVSRQVRVQVLGGRDACTVQDGIDKLLAVDCVVDCVSSTSRFTKQHPFVSHVSVKILHARASPWHQSFLLLQLPAHERVFDPVRLPVVGDEPAMVADCGCGVPPLGKQAPGTFDQVVEVMHSGLLSSRGCRCPCCLGYGCRTHYARPVQAHMAPGLRALPLALHNGPLRIRPLM